MFAFLCEAPPKMAVHESARQSASDSTITAQAAVPQQSATHIESQERELTAAQLGDIDPASVDWAEVGKSRGAKDHFDPVIGIDLLGF